MVDRSFQTRQPGYCALARSLFGDDAIRVWSSHKRVTKMLMAIQPNPALDIRELIIQTESTEPVHRQHQRPAPDEIANIYEIDEALTIPVPKSIAIVDDVLTTGAHFRAMHSVLSIRFQGAHIVGLFLAYPVYTHTH